VPPADTHLQSPLHLHLSHADRYALYRYSRFHRMAEVLELRAKLMELATLKYGKYLGKDTEVRIAGDVRQLDVMHAPAVQRHDPLLMGQAAELAFRLAATCGITKHTHKIVSIKMLLTPARVNDKPTKGEQLVHWDFTGAFLTRGMHTMLWHLSEAPGQRSTALPRFAAHHQPDDHTTDEQLRAFLQPMFDKTNYESEVVALGDVTFFDQCMPHFGTANESDLVRAVLFFMFVPINLATKDAEHADENQSYEWVLAERAYGAWSREYFEALVRNVDQMSVHRIEPLAARNEVIAFMKGQFPTLVREYNERAPKGFKI